jgi:O-antigen/teichoic acid export membrane protein
LKSQFNSLFSKLKKHHIILENFGYLGIIEIFNLVIPLMTYPYLIRTLGKDTFGLVIYAQAIVSYLVIIVSFGFSMSATKQVSLYRNDQKKLNEIVSTVLFIKGILFLLTALILVVVLFLLPQAIGHKILFVYTLWMCLYDFIFPVWFYQGIEKMKYITLLTLTSRLIFLVLIFVIIQSPSDYLKVPLINGIGSLTAGIISLYIVLSKFNIKLRFPSLSSIKFHLKDSYSLFLSDLIIAIKDKSNYLLIGAIIGHGAVTEFDLALKIKGVFSIPIDLINKALYPKISKERNMIFMQKSMWLTFILTTGITILAFLFARPITNLLGGGGMKDIVQITRILLVSIPPFTLSYFLAVNCINAHGRYFLLLKGMIYTTGFYVFFIIFGYVSGNLKSLYFYAICAVLTYVFELFYRVYIIRKNNLI